MRKLLLTLTLGVLLAGCREASGPETRSQSAMGTWYGETSATIVQQQQRAVAEPSDTTMFMEVRGELGGLLHGVVGVAAASDTALYYMEGYRRANGVMAVSYHDCSMWGDVTADTLFTATRDCWNSAGTEAVVLRKDAPPRALEIAVTYTGPDRIGWYDVEITITNNHPTLVLVVEEVALLDADGGEIRTVYFFDEAGVALPFGLIHESVSVSREPKLFRPVYSWRGTP